MGLGLCHVLQLMLLLKTSRLSCCLDRLNTSLDLPCVQVGADVEFQSEVSRGLILGEH